MPGDRVREEEDCGRTPATNDGAQQAGGADLAWRPALEIDRRRRRVANVADLPGDQASRSRPNPDTGRACKPSSITAPGREREVAESKELARTDEPPVHYTWLPPKELAWNGSWNGAADNPRAADAICAVVRVIGAASARGAGGRTSCKPQARDPLTPARSFRDEHLSQVRRYLSLIRSRLVDRMTLIRPILVPCRESPKGCVEQLPSGS